MSDIVSFSEFSSVQQIAAHSVSLPRVVLEGQDDVKYFKQFWFTDLQDRFLFVEAKMLGGAGGCTGVAGAVRYSWDVDGVPALGILDRDSLFRARCWKDLYEVDDGSFRKAVADDDIFTASLWEIEAYLFDAERLSDWVEGNYTPPPATPQACAAAAAVAIRECEILLKMAPFVGASHVNGAKVADAHFAGETEMALEEKTAIALEQLPLHHQVHAEIIRQMIDRVRTSAPAGETERLAFLLRYVDTKRLLHRLHHALKLSGTASPWQLATAMKRTGARPAEFEEAMLAFERRLAA